MSSKLKEALSKASIALSWAAHHHLTEDDAKECLEIVDAALAEPLRNCEVGTAEEQTERFKDLCRKYRRGPGPRANCKGCPIQHESPHVGCTFAWSQMPYEKGATK